MRGVGCLFNKIDGDRSFTSFGVHNRQFNRLFCCFHRRNHWCVFLQAPSKVKDIKMEYLLRQSAVDSKIRKRTEASNFYKESQNIKVHKC